jgi:2-hydroxychromene-2-carboxylate isomerase
MPVRVEFFFDYGSPFSYLADALLPGLAARTRARFEYRPMLLGGVFKATGNQSPMREPVAAKRSYGGLALRRTAARVGAPFRTNPHFPIDTLLLMRTGVAAQRAGCFEAFHRAAYPAFWAEGRNLGDPDVIAAVADAAGLDGKALVAAAGEAAVKAELRATTEEAVRRGAFGAPTFFLGDEIFFGVDHLPYLEAAIAEASR